MSDAREAVKGILKKVIEVAHSLDEHFYDNGFSDFDPEHLEAIGLLTDDYLALNEAVEPYSHSGDREIMRLWNAYDNGFGALINRLTYVAFSRN